MLGFAPLASGPLSDDTGTLIYYLGSDNVVTGNFVVPAVNMDENETFSTSDITLGVPVVDTTEVSEVNALNPNDITTGSPVVGQVDLTEENNLSGDDVTAGAVVIDFSSISQTHRASPENLYTGSPDVPVISYIPRFPLFDVVTGAVDIDPANMDQEHDFTAPNILTGAPVIDEGLLNKSFRRYVTITGNSTNGVFVYEQYNKAV